METKPGRLVRLVSDNPHDVEKVAIKKLLNYRLPDDDREARNEWVSIVEGAHEYWHDIPSEKKEMLRSFFIYVRVNRFHHVIMMVSYYIIFQMSHDSIDRVI